MPTDSLVKVGDFGIAVLQDKAGLLTESVRGMGTVGYVSPEQQYGLKVDERTDQYSLAALCYELLTGRRPLGLFPPPSRLNPQLTRELDAVVLRGLAEEPKNRFPSVQEFVTAFDQALADSPRKARLLPMAACGRDRDPARLCRAGMDRRTRVERERPDHAKDMRWSNRSRIRTAANPVQPPDVGQTA